MKKNDKEPWLIAAARFCVENSEYGFSHEGLKRHLNELDYKVNDAQVDQFFLEQIRIVPGTNIPRGNHAADGNENLYFAPYELVQKIDDHDELIFARKTAENASKASICSIVIAIVALLASILIPIFYTQTVKIETPTSQNL